MVATPNKNEAHPEYRIQLFAENKVLSIFIDKGTNLLDTHCYVGQ